MLVELQRPSASSMTGFLLYYENPSRLRPNRHSWPIAALLREDLTHFHKYKKQPPAIFISATDKWKECPKILTGFLNQNGNKVTFRTMDTSWKILINQFTEQNEELRENLLDNSILSLPIVSNDKVLLKRFLICDIKRSSSPKVFAAGWLASLVRLLSTATQYLITWMSDNTKESKRVPELNLKTSKASSAEQNGLYWVYWPIPKPSDLGTWIKWHYTTESVYSGEKLFGMYQESHPHRAGFNIMWLSEEGTQNNETTVDLLWKLECGIPQCRVVVIKGQNGKFKTFADHRAKLLLQAKLRPESEHTGNCSTWWNTINEVDMYSMHIPTSTTSLKDISASVDYFHNSKDLKNREWMQWRCGSGENLSTSLQLMIQTDAEITMEFCKLPSIKLNKPKTVINSK